MIVQFEESAVLCKINGQKQTVGLALGQVSLFPALTPLTLQNCDAGNSFIIALDPDFMLCAAHGAIPATGLELVARQAVEDPFACGVALALAAEVEAGYPGERWYGESLAEALSLHLVRHYSTGRRVLRSRKGLAQSQLRRAIEFIRGHLAEDVSLESLAAEAGLSPFHFARRFRASTGLSPHQYIIQRRLERAKELLITSRKTVAEVALELGFCDQSHFTRAFKRVYGVSPKGFLRQFVPRTKAP